METNNEFPNREIIVVKNPEAVAQAGADTLMKAALDSIRESGIFSIALSGGNTPKALYSLLADSGNQFRSRIPWEKVHFFWGDERHVPPEHQASNYRMVQETLFSKLNINIQNIHPVPTGENTAAEAANVYETEIRRFFSKERGDTPSFDLVLLGMGGDGHTASLFPGSTLLKEKDHLVMADPTPRLGHRRISLTPPLLNNASRVLFLISGREKANTLREVLEGEKEKYPAQSIAPNRGKLIWVVDRAAGEFLTPPCKKN